MIWRAMPTGDMTLAIKDDNRIVVRVDMLGQKTMEAGNNGERLCRAMNDLTAITHCINNYPIKLPHPECGLSPLPWQIKHSKKSYSVCDSTSRTICSQNITATNRDRVIAYFDAIQAAIENINKINTLQSEMIS